MKLIKLSLDHYIVVDDSEIKEGDWHLKNDKLITRSHIIDETCKKITHSTQPIERMNHGNYSSNVYLDIEKLSLQEVKELISEIDVEKKVKDYVEELIDCKSVKESERTWISAICHQIYTQALEDNKDRKWTDADVIRVVEKSRETGLTAEYILLTLQPKTEWEVEIVDGKLKLKL